MAKFLLDLFVYTGIGYNTEYTHWEQNLLLSRLKKWIDFCAHIPLVLEKSDAQSRQFINSHWHDLWKQEKYSSLEPPMGIFYKTQWARQGVKLNQLIYLELFYKNLADKIWTKKDKGIKVSPLMLTST